MPGEWRLEHKLFPYQVGFTSPPFDFDTAPSDFLRMCPETVGVHRLMLYVPDYVHGAGSPKAELWHARRFYALHVMQWRRCLRSGRLELGACLKVGHVGCAAILRGPVQRARHPLSHGRIRDGRSPARDECRKGRPERRLSLAGMVAGHGQIFAGGRFDVLWADDQGWFNSQVEVDSYRWVFDDGRYPIS
ncbi:hypothetical protein RUE5091_02060 [Ruegeria denitrificans]|uniref:Uncharacterized protein n=1 Tax=Ruegeria denitrificans TaxID=1715692 RepID=A0A0P1I9H4_9RHOB|nr:hypothetical protein RUE5091_02060 [Ruegeria denitrificans]